MFARYSRRRLCRRLRQYLYPEQRLFSTGQWVARVFYKCRAKMHVAMFVSAFAPILAPGAKRLFNEPAGTRIFHKCAQKFFFAFFRFGICTPSERGLAGRAQKPFRLKLCNRQMPSFRPPRRLATGYSKKTKNPPERPADFAKSGV